MVNVLYQKYRMEFQIQEMSMTEASRNLIQALVTEQNRIYFVNGQAVARAKLTSRLGEPLALGPTGRVPQGCYFVTSEHKDGFDSRYAAIGWICSPRILGVGRPIL